MVINKMDKERADFGHALETATDAFARSIVPFTLPIGQEADFRGVVDVVHMKAYEFDENGKAKEREMPETGRDIVERTRERLIELVAGTLITIGLLTRPAAFIASGTMAFAYFIAHAPQNFFPALNGGDAAILYCFFFLYLVFSGPGSWSVDAARGAE